MIVLCRTLPRVRELKQLMQANVENVTASRTLPRVRELKRFDGTESTDQFSRTLPRVRELKRSSEGV